MTGRASILRLFSNLSAIFLVVLALLVSAAAAQSQTNQSDAYAGFEGRPVRRIEIAAGPNSDVAAIHALIQQHEGQPLSMEALKSSVTALQQTKRYTQVQISIEPEQAGLRVVFILQPASYIGLISFPGATEKFQYTRLLQVVNIAEQSPYVEDLAEDGKQALLKFFASSGYFQAEVQPRLERDDRHLIVNIDFDCKMHRRARIGTVVLEGIAAEQEEQLDTRLKSFWARLRGTSLRPGQYYSSGRIHKAQGYLRAQLGKQGRLAPILQLEAPVYHAEKNTADVHLRISPGPLVRIKIEGARVTKRTERRLIPVYSEQAIDQDLIDEGQRNLVSYFQSKSYFDAAVSSSKTEDSQGVTIAYEVKRGKRHRVTGIKFTGNHYFDDGQLQNNIPITRARFFYNRGHFSNSELKKSVVALTAAYKNAGFAKVAIHPEVSSSGPDINVTFQIAEGPQDTVHSLQIQASDGERLVLPGEYAPGLAPGKPYSQQLLENDRNHVLAEYLNCGYLNAEFSSKTSPAEGNANSLDVVFIMTPGQQVKAKEVLLLGAEHTRPNFIRGVTASNVAEAKPISEGKDLSAEGDLYNLGTFDWASIRPLRPIGEQNEETVVIRVHESKRNTLDVGGGLEVIPRNGNVPVGAVVLPGIPPIGLGNKFRTSQKSFFGPRGSFEFARHNLFGKAETAAIGVVASRLDQRASFSYTDQRLQGTQWSSLFSASVERTTENPIFGARLGQLSYQVERALDKKHTRNVILRYSFQRTNLSNIIIPQLVLPRDQHVRLSTISAEYVRDTRDHPLDAHHGLYQTFNVEVSPTALGSNSDFVRVLGQNAFYLPVRPWLTWANSFRLGFATKFGGSYVPLSERFFSGGADSLRGFPIDGAGPQRPVNVCSNPNDQTTCTIISVPEGGLMLAIVNSEARFPIPLKQGLGGVVFYDGGNVYNNISFKQFTSGYSNNIGFGLRYNTRVGPIRLDIGRNLNPVPGVKSTQYFVTLGQAF